jgi:hypothetical protein
MGLINKGNDMNEEWKDGLPGVGVVCEAWCHSDVWGDGICVHLDTSDEGIPVAVIKLSSDDYVAFTAKRLRPIIKREPQNGEVWECDEVAFIYSQLVSTNCHFLRLDGRNAKGINGWELKYAAPDVKSYIARELLKDANHKDEFVFCFLKDAARLDEE